MEVTILGSYITQFGELWSHSLSSLLEEASLGAVESAGIDPSDIDAVFVANKAAGNFENQHHLNAIVSQFFSHYPPGFRVEAACASGSLAMLAAEHALLAGQYETVLVVGAEKMTDVSAEETTHILSGAAANEREHGSTFPALYAVLAGAHMREFGTTREQLSAVAVKNHRHALDNPKAQFHKTFSLEQVSTSQVVAEPLRLLDCSPISDGAAAVVLSTRDLKKNASSAAKKRAKILGFGHGQDSVDLASRKSLVSLSATVRAAKQAFAKASKTPTEMMMAEVHDCFSIAEILAIEDLGFFAKGQGAAATEAGLSTHGGKIVINPSGGLKACGHPVGATGVKQVAYLAELFAAGALDTALAHNVGGSGATAVVHILGK